MHEVLDNFVKSCGKYYTNIRFGLIRFTAGYCVITYILGIGDRHLDNLLLTKMGILSVFLSRFVFNYDDRKSFPH